MRAAAWLAIGVTTALVLLPAVIGGGSLSIVGMLPLAVVVLGSGLILRLRGTGSARTLGSVLSVAGVIGVGILVVLTWLLAEGWGRPF
jgi:hypothetical protein